MVCRPLHLFALLVVALPIAAGVRPAAGAGVKFAVPSADYPTIQSALDVVPDGGTVTVAANTYVESLRLTSRTNVSLVGKGVIVDSAGADVTLWVDKCTAPAISGFTFNDSTKVGVLFTDCSGGTVSKCVIDVHSGDGLRLEDSTSVLVSGCAIRNVSADGLSGLPGTVGTTVSKCVVEDIGGHGIVLYGAANSGAAPSLVTGNTVARTGRNGIVTGGANFTVSKNTVVDAGWDGVRGESFTVATTSSSFLSNTVTGGNRGVIVDGDRCWAMKNRVTGAIYGVILIGSNHIASGNSLTNLESIGVIAVATDCQIVKNKVVGSRFGYHLPAGSDGNHVTGCSAAGCEVFGFLVESTGNTLSGNKAADCGADLAYDSTTPGANTWTKNKFVESYAP